MEKTALEQIMFEAYKASRLIEFVMEKLRESGIMLFDPEEVSVNDQSIGDLMRRRNRLFQKAKNKLLDHKLHPVIDPGHGELIIDEANNVAIQSGWDSTFTIRSSTSTEGSLTVGNSGGTIAAEYIVIR